MPETKRVSYKETILAFGNFEGECPNKHRRNSRSIHPADKHKFGLSFIELPKTLSKSVNQSVQHKGWSLMGY